jgi:NTP pyrophosphatase (non-canonical NTP hydrolase)
VKIYLLMNKDKDAVSAHWMECDAYSNRHESDYVLSVELDPLTIPVAYYFDFRGNKFPNTDQSMHFLTSEIGELADEIVQSQSEDWVRNNPQNKGKGIAPELGDVLMMSTVLGISLEEHPICPVEAMFDKLKAKGFDQEAYRPGDKKPGGLNGNQGSAGK